MSNQVVWEGLAELKAALGQLPKRLAAEASAIVTDSAYAARDEIVAAYPKRTGALRRGVKVKLESVGQYGAGASVINTAPHAHLFEFGTQARHTKLGASRGSMPPGNIFVPRVIKHRRRMYDELKEMLKREGLIVTGDVDSKVG
jgi:hypothetical protein